MHGRFGAALLSLERVLERLERPLPHAQGRPALQVVLDQLAPVVRQQALGPHRVQLRLGHLGTNKQRDIEVTGVRIVGLWRSVGSPLALM